YCPDSMATIFPVQRALKPSTLMPTAGEPPPQSKLTLPSTRLIGVPVRSRLLKYAADRPVTGVVAATTVTLAVLATLPLAARMTPVPVPSGVLYSPVVVMAPTPVMLHAKAGGEARARPNWSSAVALNCCAAPLDRVTFAGETLMEVRT